MDSSPSVARRFWEAIEPIHAVVYFTPEPADAARLIGLRGWWMGYFAGRVAPLGPIPAEAVTAVTFGFAPAMVHRAIPDAWSIADPQLVLETRFEAVGVALRRVLTPSQAVRLRELRPLLWRAIEGCRFDGRPLSAAWSGVSRPDDPVADAWLATTIIREHRGDGHVLAAVAAGLDGLDASVTLVAARGTTRDAIQPNRGWSDDEWDQSRQRLESLGLLDEDGALTDAGWRLRELIEDTTDRLAAPVVDQLGVTGASSLVELAGAIGAHLVDIGTVPVPNPMGAPRPAMNR